VHSMSDDESEVELPMISEFLWAGMIGRSSERSSRSIGAS
jgi:hypothetical protein